MTALIDNGATHNFIDKDLTKRLWLETQDFKGFKVSLADRFTTSCTRKTLQLNISIGKHEIKDKFCTVKLGDRFNFGYPLVRFTRRY